MMKYISGVQPKIQQPTTSIPKLIHFIWVGPNKLPEEYSRYVQSWIDMNPSYTFMFWHDYNLPSLTFTSGVYSRSKVYAMKADILRYEILYRYGGIYIDTDFLCIRPLPDQFLKKTFFACENPGTVSIGIIGATVNDPFLLFILQNLRDRKIDFSNPNISALTGPIFITEMYNIYMYKNHITLYPPSMFYRYTYQDKYVDKIEPNIDQYSLDPDCYGIHMWGHSWDPSKTNSNRRVGEFPFSHRYINTEVTYTSSVNAYRSSTHKKAAVFICSDMWCGGIERYTSIVSSSDIFKDNDIYILIRRKIHNNLYYTYAGKIMVYHTEEMLNRFLVDINPHIIIDSSFIYFSDEEYAARYRDVKTCIIHVMHTSILYTKDISNRRIQNMVHLYKEKNPHSSWNNIPKQTVIPLGIHGNLTLRVSIIGRIAEDKITEDAIKDLSVLPYTFQLYGLQHHEYSLKLSTNMKKNGFKPVDEIMSNTDCVLFLCPETGSYAAVESMFNNKYIVAKRCPGMTALLEGYSRHILYDDYSELNTILNKIEKSVYPDILRKHTVTATCELLKTFIYDCLIPV